MFVTLGALVGFAWALSATPKELSWPNPLKEPEPFGWVDSAEDGDALRVAARVVEQVAAGKDRPVGTDSRSGQ
jgi:hypothetical protein